MNNNYVTREEYEKLLYDYDELREILNALEIVTHSQSDTLSDIASTLGLMLHAQKRDQKALLETIIKEIRSLKSG